MLAEAFVVRTLFVYKAPQERAARGDLEREGRPLGMRTTLDQDCEGRAAHGNLDS